MEVNNLVDLDKESLNKFTDIPYDNIQVDIVLDDKVLSNYGVSIGRTMDFYDLMLILEVHAEGYGLTELAPADITFGLYDGEEAKANFSISSEDIRSWVASILDEFTYEEKDDFEMRKAVVPSKQIN